MRHNISESNLKDGDQMGSAELLVNKLIEKGYKIASAESCTGGLFASKIVEVPNASSVLDMSFITYSNESKTELLGVSQSLIDTYGVVSEEVALKMAYGVSKKAASDIGVGISGIAGPTGATATKPIGMVCFGFYVAGQSYSITKYFGDIGRNNVRNMSVAFAIDFLNNIL